MQLLAYLFIPIINKEGYFHTVHIRYFIGSLVLFIVLDNIVLYLSLRIYVFVVTISHILSSYVEQKIKGKQAIYRKFIEIRYIGLQSIEQSIVKVFNVENIAVDNELTINYSLPHFHFLYKYQSINNDTKC